MLYIRFKIRVGTFGQSFGPPSLLLGQCPKFGRFSILQPSLIYFASDCLPSDMISCKAGHRFCKICVITTAEGVLARGMGVVRCLDKCDLEMELNQLQKVLKANVMSKLVANRQAEELSAAGLENCVSCPFCPYQTIMDNPEDKVVSCLNPECGRDSCRMCKLSNHVPYTCKEYQENVLDVSRRKVEEELTMSWVRQCWNCNVNIERISGCNIMTCPKCGKKTCYACRKAVDGSVREQYNLHIRCGKLSYAVNNRLHDTELKNAEEKIKSEMTEQEQEALDLFKPGTSKQ